MKTLQIHNTTRKLLERLAENPPHALLLVGATGMGKYTLAKAWARQLVDSDFAMSAVTPDDKGTISITTIRELYDQLKSKPSGQFVVIIQDAESMGIEAQNAFLKLLEEPKQGVTFILTATHGQVLLPTIHSRVQEVIVRPVPSEHIEAIVKRQEPKLSSTELTQIVFIANGRPGTAMRMAQDEAYKAQQKQSMQLAKQLLSADMYDRLLLLSELTDKNQTIATLEAMQRILLLQLIKMTTRKQTEAFTKKLEAIDACLQKITQNGNVRVQLLRLFSDNLV